MSVRTPRKPRTVLWGGRSTDWIIGHEPTLHITTLPGRVLAGVPYLVEIDGHRFWTLLDDGTSTPHGTRKPT